MKKEKEGKQDKTVIPCYFNVSLPTPSQSLWNSGVGAVQRGLDDLSNHSTVHTIAKKFPNQWVCMINHPTSSLPKIP